MPKNSRSQKQEYIVERVVDKKLQGKKIFYYVKWQGYDDCDNTWEPQGNLLPGCKELIEQYNQSIIEQQSNGESKSKNSNQDKSDEKKKKKQEDKTDIENSEKTENSKQESESETKANSKEDKKTKDQRSTRIQESLLVKRQGSFELKDVPLKIRKAYREGELNEIKMEVEWKSDKKGKIKPQNSYYTNTQIKKYNKDLVIDFYESKITFKSVSLNQNVQVPKQEAKQQEKQEQQQQNNINNNGNNQENQNNATEKTTETDTKTDNQVETTNATNGEEQKKE